jgi:uncharacterized protein YukE
MGIKMDYTAVMREVTKLRTIATELRRQQTACRSARSEVPSFWAGASADAVTAKLITWERDVNNAASEIEQLAAEVKRVADAIKTADEAMSSSIGPSGGGGGSR